MPVTVHTWVVGIGLTNQARIPPKSTPRDGDSEGSSCCVAEWRKPILGFFAGELRVPGRRASGDRNLSPHPLSDVLFLRSNGVGIDGGGTEAGTNQLAFWYT